MLNNIDTREDSNALASFAFGIFQKALEQYPTDEPKRFDLILQSLDEFQSKLDEIILKHTQTV